MFQNIIFLIFLTLIPLLELRYSIPAGILAGSIELPFGFSLVGLGMPWLPVFLICVTANFFLGILVFLMLKTFVKYMMQFEWFDAVYTRAVATPQRKIKKYVDKYGEFGVALFIAVPLPGSGVYSGSLGAYAIGLNFKKFIIADLIGVVIAGSLVTLITVTGKGLFG